MATSRSTSYLNGKWVTGYTPTQSDFQDLFASYENIVDGNLLTGNDSAIAAVYPATQGTAYQLTKKVNNVQTAPTGICGIKLPQAKAGMICYVFVNAANTVKIYPYSGDGIAAGAANVPFTLRTQTAAMFVCSIDGIWFANLSTILQYEYTEYVALLTQTGTAAPVATILQNTTDFTFTPGYISEGKYDLTPSASLNSAKTTVSISCKAGHDTVFGAVVTDAGDDVLISTIAVSDGSSNGQLHKTAVIIRIYP
jgi:hypothetical protein